MRAFSIFTALATFASIVSAAPVSNSANIYSKCNRPGIFALTFDDGPYEYSWDLATYLHSRGVKATFFTNGHNYVTEDFGTATTSTESDGPQTYLNVLKHYHDLGHEIGSHTYEHVVLKGLTGEQVEYQMNQQSDLIYRATGQRPRLMRPPEGELDDASSAVIASLGYSVILWDIDTKDYESESLTAERPIVEQGVSDITSGHIMLQHDVHSQSAKELTPWAIDYILSHNYTFVTVSECLGIQPYQ